MLIPSEENLKAVGDPFIKFTHQAAGRDFPKKEKKSVPHLPRLKKSKKGEKDMGRKKKFQRIIAEKYNKDYDNDFHKINQETRDTYEYHFTENLAMENDKGDLYITRAFQIDAKTLMDSDETITEDAANEIILVLHQMRDVEIKHNLENAKPPITDEQRDELKEWVRAHPGEKPPKNYNISINGFLTSDDDLYDEDKSPIARATATTDAYDLEDRNEVRRCLSALNDEQFDVVKDRVLEYMNQFDFGIDHIRKILEPLTDMQFARYLLVKLIGLEGKKVAAIFGVSPSKITKSINCAEEKIEELKKIKESIGEGEF